MKMFVDYIKKNPRILLSLIITWILFAIVITLLTTYPLMKDYAFSHPSLFLRLETISSFLTYSYNSQAGGIVNYLNTFLFGVWVLTFMIYKRTVVDQGKALSEAYNAKKGTWGGLIALLGGGCIGCGFTFLTNIFGATLGTFLVTLPLRGAEIGIIGTIIIFISVMRSLKQLDQFVPETIPVVSSVSTPAPSSSQQIPVVQGPQSPQPIPVVSTPAVNPNETPHNSIPTV